MLEVIHTFQSTNDQMEGNTRKIGPEYIDELIQCQEMAIMLGNYLDTLGGPAIALVKILEDYCENLYQISISLSEEKQYKKLSKVVQKQLVQLYNRIKYDLPEDKREIVFLPYKASMWDSLESVWMAADKDESCDVYVIPIPYYDKNPDGTFGQIHYEGKEYPDYVPITSWKEYDLAERRPDLIYIHNPYDDWNYITSVHPNFYAKELKKYTDTLIYIPYFISVNDVVEKHFCVMPGTLYADWVIVQSEEIRKMYVKELNKFGREHHSENLFGKAEQKVIALGSPKYDKVCCTKKKDLVIPEEWKRVLKNSDGDCKKVILYNTTISPFLNSGMRALEKIESTLQIFKKQKDIVLLWRPHPLIQATLQSMRPELLNRFKAIRKQYCEDGWGIYDDTCDMGRAITLSDAYYGDGGSLLALYLLTEKPVLVQNHEILVEM